MTTKEEERKELLKLGQKIRRLDPAYRARDVEHNRKYRRRLAFREKNQFMPWCTCEHCVPLRVAFDKINGKK